MRRVFLALVVAAIVVAVAWWLAGLPGHVVATVQGISFETSTPIAILAVVILVLVLHLLLRGLTALLMLPRRWRGWRRTRRREQGDVAVTRTLVALAAGDASDSRHHAQRARRLLGDTAQTLLLAAEAGRLSGNDAEAETLYRDLAAREDAAFLGLRGLFRQAVAREDWDAAAELARRAEAVHPGAAWLREERTNFAVRTGDWAQALALAGPDAPRLAYAVAAADASTDDVEATRLAKRTWRDHPGFAPAALAYARRLRQAARERQALDVVREAWRSGPHPDLASFALQGIEPPLARVKEAERLTASRPDDPESQYLLARVSLDAGLIGEARRHAEAAARLGMKQKRLWLLMADLEGEEHGDTEAGRAAQRDALRHAAGAEPDPVWRCEACGTVHAQWLPACPVCHEPGRIVWGGQKRLALAR